MPGRGFRSGVPVIKVKDIKDGQIDTSDLLLTDPRIDEAYRRSRIRTGDLLFTIRGTVGRMAFVPPELDAANITQDTARISLLNTNPFFIARWLEMPISARFIDVHTIGVAVKGINLGDVRRIPVVVPPKSEQDQIARILASHEEMISMECNELACLLKLKSGLMTDLLTGRVRVPEHFGMRRHDAALSSQAHEPASGPFRPESAHESGDTSPHSKGE
jgi:type I restriction enzyme S subunit